MIADMATAQKVVEKYTKYLQKKHKYSSVNFMIKLHQETRNVVTKGGYS